MLKLRLMHICTSFEKKKEMKIYLKSYLIKNFENFQYSNFDKVEFLKIEKKNTKF